MLEKHELKERELAKRALKKSGLCASLFVALLALSIQGYGSADYSPQVSERSTTIGAPANVIKTATKTATETTIKIAATSATATIKDIRMWHAPERSRIVFDMDRRAAFKVFTLKQPDRVVIDLGDVKIKSAIPAASATGQFIRKIRFGAPQKNVTRLVFDLDKPVRYFIQMLKPSDLYQYRLVVDFFHQSAVVAADKPARPKPKPTEPKRKAKLLVLIDPGHGGEDPGAIGRRTQEKKVVLQIAKKLKAKINKQRGLRAELTRDKDYYVGLRKRTRIARQRQADFFVSIHADAFVKKSARGASVYALSQGGASSEAARWLAKKENAADLAGGVSLADKDALLAEVLLDLSMTKNISDSISFGRDVLGELKKIGKVHSKRVEQAGFVVLKSPDIPSILVETAYITNPTDEKLLRSSKHQNRIANAIVAGIKRFIKKNRSRYATR